MNVKLKTILISSIISLGMSSPLAIAASANGVATVNVKSPIVVTDTGTFAFPTMVPNQAAADTTTVTVTSETGAQFNMLVLPSVASPLPCTGPNNAAVTFGAEWDASNSDLLLGVTSTGTNNLDLYGEVTVYPDADAGQYTCEYTVHATYD